MLGLSFWKVVLLVAVVAAVYFGFRWFERAQNEKRIADRRAGGGAAGGGAAGTGAGAGARSDVTTHDLVACRVCGAFVAEGARACSRSNCPLPR
jgi:uncharacterized protein